MNASSRYQSQALYLQQGDISCYLGVDPLTGLAVLIYTFADRPTATVGTLESENIPGILASSFDDTAGQLVAAYSSHYGLVAAGESSVDDRFALEALRAVRDASKAGVVHGDLRAGRLLYSQGHVLVEGYGVPWRPVDADVIAPEVAAGAKPSLASDLYAIAATLLLLGGTNFSGEVSEALRSALAKQARERPTVTALYGRVRRACGGAVTPPARSFEDLTLPTGAEERPLRPEPAAPAVGAVEHGDGPGKLSATRSDFQLDLEFELDVTTPPPDENVLMSAPRPTPKAPPADAAAVTGDEPEPITLQSDPGLSARGLAGASVHDSSPGFVKDLPPGATYRAGNLDDAQPPAPIRLDLPTADRPRRRSWRGPLLVVLALVAAGALVALAFLNQGPLAPSPSPGNGVNYIVAVQVEPTNLPPVDLYVVKSPAGSATPAGTILCRAPCKVVLDRAGEWQFRAVFQNQRSEIADAKLPGQLSVTVAFPAGTGASGNSVPNHP